MCTTQSSLVALELWRGREPIPALTVRAWACLHMTRGLAASAHQPQEEDEVVGGCAGSPGGRS